MAFGDRIHKAVVEVCWLVGGGRRCDTRFAVTSACAGPSLNGWDVRLARCPGDTARMRLSWLRAGLAVHQPLPGNRRVCYLPNCGGDLGRPTQSPRSPCSIRLLPPCFAGQAGFDGSRLRTNCDFCGPRLARLWLSSSCPLSPPARAPVGAKRQPARRDSGQCFRAAPPCSWGHRSPRLPRRATEQKETPHRQTVHG